MLVKDLTIENVASVDARGDVLDALIVMFSRRQRILPVFDESKFVGTVSVSSYAKVLQDLGKRKPESIRVREIMDKNMTIVSPTTDIRQVIDRICEKGSYGVPVVSGHEFKGILGRAEILKHFLHLLRGKFKVIDVMSYYVSTNSVHDAVEAVARKIITGDDRRIVIMNNKDVEGTIGIKDLANVLLTEKADLSTLSVKDILVPNTVTVRKSDDAAKAAEIMLEWWIGGVPVVEDKLEGIVRDKDILQRLRLVI